MGHELEPTRERLEAATVRLLRRQTRLNPDLRLLDWNGVPAVAKDWNRAPWLLKLYGRWSLGREWHLLGRLDGIVGIPRPLARGRHVIVMGFLEGRTLSSRLAPELPPDYFPRLEAVVARMHERGVVHLDLRQRQNVLLGADGQPCVLDFGAGLDLGRFGWPGRLLLRWLSRVDRTAVLKLKGKYAGALLDERERRRAASARRARYYWPPNWFKGTKTRIRRALRGDSDGEED